VRSVHDGWDELSITSENAPTPADEVVAEIGKTPGSGWIELDVTKAVRSPGGVSLAVVAKGKRAFSISSRESAMPPELRMEVEVEDAQTTDDSIVTERVLLAEDTFTRKSAASWGTADAGGEWSVLAGSSADFSVSNASAGIALSAVNSTRLVALMGARSGLPQLEMRFRLSETPLGASVYVIPATRIIDSNNLYGVRITVPTSGSASLVGYKRVDGTNLSFGSAASISSVVAKTWYRVKTEAEGTAPTLVRAKVWRDGDPEPSYWQLEARDSQPELQQANGSPGLRTTLAMGNTNDLPYVVNVDDVRFNGVTAEVPQDPVAVRELPVVEGEAMLKLRYAMDASRVVGEPSRLVVAVHGDSRNWLGYLDYLQGAAAAAENSNSILVAPQFVTAEEIEGQELTDQYLYWSSSGWKYGNLSLASPYARPFAYSSFAALDRLIESLVASYPSITEVVVAGHSAGGQFAQRYALSTRLPQAHQNVAFTFAPMNAGSYCYLDANRWSGSAFEPLSAEQQDEAPGWNDYRYGLQRLNSYLGAVGASRLRAQFEDRRVIYALGTMDTDPDAPNLDTSPAAQWQGRHRFERGRLFFGHLAAHYGSPPSSHLQLEVPGVGHSGRGMLISDALRPYLFGPAKWVR
jgi:pimeloyl-ACP methyl ester carboxylesterase